MECDLFMAKDYYNEINSILTYYELGKSKEAKHDLKWAINKLTVYKRKRKLNAREVENLEDRIINLLMK